jgi:signal transduction histidine kinase
MADALDSSRSRSPTAVRAFPRTHLSRIFAPFFSTKSRGSGLGLALSQRIVTQHGGTLVYDPPSSGGARFRMTLPVSDTHDFRDD